jgi:hypothetical protein
VRFTDRSTVAAAWGRWGRDAVSFFAVAMAAWSVMLSHHDLTNFKREAEERRHETCLINERKQRMDVDALQRTYEYLAGLSAEQLAQPLNRAVLAQLPRTVREAQVDDAPRYCDEPGVGEPEPDPRLPVAPENLPEG